MNLMNFEKHKLENTESEVNTIALVVQEITSWNFSEKCITENILCAYLTISEAQKEADRLIKLNHSENITYYTYCVPLKSKIECEHPFYAIQTRGEINLCLSCGKNL